MIAIKNCDEPAGIEFIKSLIHHKADINIPDNTGWTALMYVMCDLDKCIQNTCARILLENKAVIRYDKKWMNLMFNDWKLLGLCSKLLKHYKITDIFDDSHKI